MLRFNDVADTVLEHNPHSDLSLLKRAYVFSAKVHEGQERVSGEPYLIHPLEVAGILADMRLDEVAVATGLLHDTVEDTLTTLDEIKRLFGEEVAFLVEGLTKLAKVEFTSRTEREAENFRKMLLAMSKDIRILLIKLVDRLHNMRTLSVMQEESARRIAQETQEIYVPLAHRLGIHWLKEELEDLAFRTLKPMVAKELERKLKNNRRARQKYVDEVIATLQEKLVEANLEGEVTGRLKSLSSIHAKMEAGGLRFDEIYDVIAFRIILDAPKDVVYTALGLVHGTWAPVAGRFKDYVALPKPNGYQSLHTTVIGRYGERMEIQIRTLEMHQSAEHGIAAHWLYKSGGFKGSLEDDQRFAWLRQLLEWQRELVDPHEFLDTVKVDLFPHEVYVFTPKGKVLSLPKNASPIDFAYAIHTEVGDTCSGARVNGKLVSLRTKLSDGDTVEILTTASQTPRKDWLDFVVTSKARNRIRQVIRLEGRRRSQDLGRGIMEKELRRRGHSLSRLLSSGALESLAKEKIGGGPVEDLFGQVGVGRIEVDELLTELFPADAPPPGQKPTDRIKDFFRDGIISSKSGILVSGMNDVLCRFAKCCSPVPGDDITGFITRGRGVTIHVSSCRKVFELDPERRVDVRWDLHADVIRSIRIRVSSTNKQGLLAAVTKAIAGSKIDIEGAQVRTTQDDKAVLIFDVSISHLRSLNGIMKRIERIPGVLSVERVNS